MRMSFIVCVLLSACGDDSVGDPDKDGFIGDMDCDETNATINAGANETCDNVDNNCDGVVDNDAADAPTWYPDQDGDGAGAATPVAACAQPENHVVNANDCDDTNAEVAAMCAIGETGPGGGVIFLTPTSPGNTTGHYFELAPSSSEVASPWCNDGTSSPYVDTLIGTGTAIGTGKANTAAMIQFCAGSGAATIATSYAGGGKSDWFLPSKDELFAVYSNLQVNALTDFPAIDVYTSSSENDATSAWFQDIADRYGMGADSAVVESKNKQNWYPIFVRPVRSY